MIELYRKNKTVFTEILENLRFKKRVCNNEVVCPIWSQVILFYFFKLIN